MQAGIAVRIVGRTRGSPWHSSPGTRRGDCFLRLLHSGRGWLRDPTGTWPLLPRHCCLLTPDVESQVWADPDDPYHFLRVSYSGRDAERLTRRICSAQGRRVFPCPDWASCWRDLEALYPLERSVGPELLGMVEARVLLLLTRLLPEEERQQDDGLEWQRLTGWLEEHLAERLDVPSLAERFSVSTATLTRFTRRMAGCSPAVLVQDLRMQRARGLLRMTGLPVAEIARRVGYHDPFHFSRVYARRHGRSPRAWRAAPDSDI